MFTIAVIGAVTGIFGSLLGLYKAYQSKQTNQRALRADVYPIYASFGTPLVGNTIPVIKIEIANYGKTEAHLRVDVYTDYVRNGGTLSAKHSDFPSPSNLFSWPPGKTDKFYFQNDSPFDDKAIAELTNGKARFYVRGRLYYEDAFTKKGTSRELCFVYPEVQVVQNSTRHDPNDLDFSLTPIQ